MFKVNTATLDKKVGKFLFSVHVITRKGSSP